VITSTASTTRITRLRTAHVLAPGVGEAADPVAGLHLDPARARELGRRPARHYPAADQDRHAVAHQLDLAEHVGAEHHRHPAAAHLAEQVADHAPADGVESAAGLVEHQEPRRAHERLGDAESLLHALRHGGHLHGAGFLQAHELEQLRALGGATV
jgi:hypothetical protein